MSQDIELMNEEELDNVVGGFGEEMNINFQIPIGHVLMGPGRLDPG